ncbi:MAG: TIGR00725 family protein [Actinobacteria bacterium]|nr:TIGR00725 family protein [Actinomycetota bacterium]PLS84653.1 MAG: TIGR00725 family protein [Actinomycetota bacterium]
MSEGPNRPRYVSVIGPGDANEEIYGLAREVGRLVARRGGIVVCGGLAGVMEAAARGAAEEGGAAIGILPDVDRRRANSYLSYSVATGVGEARNLAVVCSADVVISVGGGYGTLSEIGLAKKVGRPVVSLRGWDLGEHVVVASSPEEAVGMALP